MNDFKVLQINSFRKNNSFFKDEEKKKSFLSLNKNSVFLKRVIESKEKERKSQKKLLILKPNKTTNDEENCKNCETLTDEPFQEIYKNPKYLKKLLIVTKADYPNKRYTNYTTNIKEISTQKTNNSISSRINKMNRSFCERYSFNNYLTKNLKSQFCSQNVLYKNNSKNFYKFKNESNTLLFNGKKLFAPLSLSEQSNNEKDINSPKLNENKSELFRNYNELNLKKEQIYKRKIKKNLSVENRIILKTENEKEIKKQTLENLTKSYNIKNFDYMKKIKQIPKGNKKQKRTFGKENCPKKINIQERNKISRNNNIKNIKTIIQRNNIKNDYEIKQKSKTNQYNITLVAKRKNFDININRNSLIKQVISNINNRKKQHYDKNINNDENKENFNQNIINLNINTKKKATKRLIYIEIPKIKKVK